ncbi:expressed protein [Phakopsora pachyrhizi]|uniref:Expressed protein n=1 Tax=Phakopsora pachyrhizi TaxID=170000 RepID=A0AAV0BEZ0_PHAPC|nr:expressed protein [Phakopsora pachyrhizi]
MSLDRFLGLISGEDACNEGEVLVLGQSTEAVVGDCSRGQGLYGWSRGHRGSLVKGAQGRTIISSTGKISREMFFAPEQLVIGTPGFKVPAIETLAIGRIMGGEVEVEVDEEEIISQSMGAGEDEGEGEADEGNCDGGD